VNRVQMAIEFGCGMNDMSLGTTFASARSDRFDVLIISILIVRLCASAWHLHEHMRCAL